jgi:hypothetical protein
MIIGVIVSTENREEGVAGGDREEVGMTADVEELQAEATIETEEALPTESVLCSLLRNLVRQFRAQCLHRL